uniref:Fibrinogen alpha/beta/gamma chain coiled coil domain-containing protein n=1 Tax=Echeneis naucrates TaxID=173247 RepID=A0A665T2D7_ECHNA
MERRNLHACLALMFVASALVSFTSSSSRRHFNATVVDPRGNRPVVPGTRSEKCASQKEWPFCLDDDWGHKCPSGCRIQGLIDRDDHENLKRIEKIRDLLDQNNAKHRSTDVVSNRHSESDRVEADFFAVCLITPSFLGRVRPEVCGTCRRTVQRFLLPTEKNVHSVATTPRAADQRPETDGRLVSS